jgi:hypothetical protein
VPAFLFKNTIKKIKRKEKKLMKTCEISMTSRFDLLVFVLASVLWNVKRQYAVDFKTIFAVEITV